MKLKLFFIAILLSITLLACQINKPTTLDTPQNLAIEENILSFDVVDNAIKYRIEARDLATNNVRKYFVELNQNLDLLYMPPAQYAIKIQAVGNGKEYLDSAFSDDINYTQKDPFQVNEIKEDYLLDDLKVKWFGRHAYQSATKANYFYFTASGFEVKFFGTSLNAELITGTNPNEKQPHLLVFIDGENNPNQAKLVVMDQIKKTYILAENLPDGMHTIKVLKRSESIDSLTGLSKLQTDGYFVDVDPYRPRKIEVIAASSSAGFGNLAANTNEAKTTQNSDGLRAYAFLAARMVDAEINIFSASGWPLLKGPWTGNNNIPSAYDYVNVYSAVEWNHQSYVPDVVIINLGTNDWSYINQLTTSERPQAILNFEDAFVSFIGRIHQLHPNAIIVIAYGLMNETHIYTPTLNVVAKAQNQYKNLNLFSIQLPSVNAAEGIGSSNHPSLATHIRAAGILADKLSIWLDWLVANPNINQV